MYLPSFVLTSPLTHPLLLYPTTSSFISHPLHIVSTPPLHLTLFLYLKTPPSAFPSLLLQRCYYSYSQSILLPHLFYPPPLPFNILLHLSFSLPFSSLPLDIKTLLYLSISQAAAASLCSSIARSRRDTLSLCASVSWDALKS